VLWLSQADPPPLHDPAVWAPRAEKSASSAYYIDSLLSVRVFPAFSCLLGVL
jgi:hypothetical protein